MKPHAPFVRLSERLQSITLIVQGVLLGRLLILAIGEGGSPFGRAVVALTNPLGQPLRALVTPVGAGPYLIEPATALFVVVLPFVVGAAAIAVDLRRLRRKEAASLDAPLAADVSLQES